jgi:murein DD-endopeptidase MepM/ murein hydrolase activator NlpD
MKTRLILVLFLAVLTFTSVLKAGQVTQQPAAADIWFGDHFYTNGVNDDKLQVGGWGDQYRILIKFDISTLPPNATEAVVLLYTYPKPDAAGPTGFYVDQVAGPWDNNTGWNNQPIANPQIGAIPTPLSNPVSINITSLYNQWKAGTATNYGIRLRPASTNNYFTWFRSSDYTADPSLRPKLVVTPSGTTDTVTYQPQAEDGIDMWYNNMFYNLTAVNDGKLQVGGWGDTYDTLIRFNLNCLPMVALTATLRLYAYDRGDGSSPTTMNLHQMDSSWNETNTAWNSAGHHLIRGGLSAPPKNQWYDIDITSLYNSWQNGTANYGLLLEPSTPNPNNLFNVFYSSDYANANLRPKLEVTYTRQTGQPFKICFPLKQDGYSPYKAPLTAIFDHHMHLGDCPDDIVTAYNGEQGFHSAGYSDWNFPSSTANCPGELLRGLAKDPSDPTGPLFSLNGQYQDAQTQRRYLYYDGHTGYDYPVGIGTPIYATADGIARVDGGNFNTLAIVHDSGGYETYYLHLSGYSVTTGQHVKKGDLVAFSGEKGVEGHPHLHVTIKKNGVRVDPYGWTGTYEDPYPSLNGDVQNVLLWEP